ncbi:hypothetical protein KBTX_02330 [wastewater metagenome]|uniref:Uncharacterized protein n=2 Tax=unclassified sequences TaxID=12908 RepID=A0A5B8RBI8_9ZZZZ|nr:type VI secretion system-associated protein TagF [Arhodomonas sp. KWT]QEA06001.1 hypothetical protein KBTEX_02330 [uncultured organism]
MAMIGCFGKVPSCADFIGVNAAGDAVRELDGRLQAGLLELSEQPDWIACFDALPIVYFGFRARDGSDVIGGMISSCDASGRRYPFLVFQVIEAWRRHVPIGCVHTLCEMFAGRIRPILINAVHGDATTDPGGQIRELRALSDEDIALYERVHARLLEDFSFADIAATLRQGWPEFVTGACLHRLAVLMGQWRYGRRRPTAFLPLPAERGLKRSVADLWHRWLGEQLPGPEPSPAMSLLFDDFMRPRLLLVPPSDDAGHFYPLLAGRDGGDHGHDVLAAFGTGVWHPGTLALPDERLPLAEFTARFTELLERDIANGWDA